MTSTPSEKELATKSPLTLDPVCGMEVDPSDSGGETVHEGRTYHFCSEGCLEEFRADPSEYLDPEKIRARVAALPKDATFTCPMHPEIEQTGPGHCPKCGMALEPKEVSLGEVENPELRDFTRRMIVGAVFTVPLVFLSMGGMISRTDLSGEWFGSSANWIQWALATPVFLYSGWPLLYRSVQSFRTAHLNMFSLIGLGTAVAYFYSLAATLAPQWFPSTFRDVHSGSIGVYYEATAVIIVLVLLGQILELRARGQTSGAIRALLGLNPKTARVVATDGTESDIDLDRITIGQRVRVRPGERVGVDGVVREGAGSIDESMITGESMPVSKGIGDTVTGGTQNLTGSFLVEATRVGAASTLAQIVRLVSEAQRSRAPIQRLADRMAGIFVPAVIAVSVVTAIVWGFFGPAPSWSYAIVNAVAVLIIACPCALGLATPMSILVGTGRGAREGVLIRNAEALETFEKIDTLVIDKTGTLTEGKPKLTELRAFAPFDEKEVLGKAAALERRSEHPLAAAVIAGAAERGIPSDGTVTEFTSVTGKGVLGHVAGREVALGSEAWMIERGASSGEFADGARSMRERGFAVVSIAIDGKIAGLLGVVDPIKPSARATLDALRADGLRIILLTGDHADTAKRVGEALGITEIEAGALPDRKAAVVTELKRAGRRVAMAGDGINDAPALAIADVGIAMGGGADIAMQSAGITLMRGDLAHLLTARKLSGAVMRNIRQNLFFAFAYNLAGVPLAAGILYPFFGTLLNPMWASAAMSLSSVSVIANALRLRTVRLGLTSEGT